MKTNNRAVKSFCLLMAVAVFTSAVGCGIPANSKGESTASLVQSVSSTPENSGASPSSSSAVTEPSSVPEPAYAGSEYYRKLVENKAEITKVVAQRVEQYRNGTPPDNPNHHPPYPADFPPVTQLPVITAPEQFAIREETNIDALGAIYAAVRIDSTHEMRIDISQWDDGGKVSWGSGNTWIVSASDRGYYGWVLTDVDIHGGELPGDFMGRALLRGLSEEQVHMLITTSLSRDDILNLPMRDIEFAYRRTYAANIVDNEGFTTLDYAWITNMDGTVEETWVQTGDNFLGMTIENVFVKGIPFNNYIFGAVIEDVQFTGATKVSGRFEKQDNGLVFIVAEEQLGGLPSLRGCNEMNVIVFNNQQTAEARAAETPDAFTECRIIIENYHLKRTNDTVKIIYNEAGECVEYDADDTKYLYVQSADIR